MLSKEREGVDRQKQRGRETKREIERRKRDKRRGRERESIQQDNYSKTGKYYYSSVFPAKLIFFPQLSG